jgi:type VI secretion system secreted protein Hcp
MAVVDYFLKIDGIPGESHDDKHRGEIDVLSFSWDISRSRNPRRGPADFQIVKTVDAASPLLFQAACQGTSPGQAVFVARKAGRDQQEFLKITLKEVIITSVSPSSVSSGDAPVEVVHLGFRSAAMDVVTQKADGSAGPTVSGTCDAGSCDDDGSR